MSYDQPYDGSASPPPPPQNGAGRSKVQGPAVGLIVTAVLGALAQIVLMVLRMVGLGIGAAQMENDPDIPPEMAEQMQLITMLSGTVGLILGGLAIIIAIVILVGAVKMKNLQSYGFAMTASVLAMIPCISPCCLLGLPIGIWAIVVLSDPVVKNSFK